MVFRGARAFPARFRVPLELVGTGTRVAPHGMGIAESLLRDERGPIGRSVQSLIIEPR